MPNAIKQLNGLQSNVVFVGQFLRLPPTALLADGQIVSTAEYSVQSGETLADIAHSQNQRRGLWLH